eukprot:1161181-Pelagomonas_calceolata.AAC.6
MDDAQFCVIVFLGGCPKAHPAIGLQPCYWVRRTREWLRGVNQDCTPPCPLRMPETARLDLICLWHMRKGKKSLGSPGLAVHPFETGRPVRDHAPLEKRA